MRRRISAAINFPEPGPTSASAGIKKNVWNAIMPTHGAPKKTWENRRTSIKGDSLPSNRGTKRAASDRGI